MCISIKFKSGTSVFLVSVDEVDHDNKLLYVYFINGTCKAFELKT